MPRLKDDKLYSNFLLPNNFIKRWKQGDTDEKYLYLDFSGDLTIELELDNQPYIQKLFSVDDSFNEILVERQWNKIAYAARKLVDLRIINQEEVKLTKNEILFLKYFGFLISLVNGDYKFHFNAGAKSYRAFDVLSEKIDFKISHDILVVINYVIFELYDVLFTEVLFSHNLQEYIDETGINYAEHSMYKQIIVLSDELKNQTFRFIQAAFFHFITNTFLKFFHTEETETNSFYLTNKSIANFIDESTKMTLLSVMVIDPYYSIGFVNLGPGRGEYRPFFQYFKNTDLNKIMLPSSLVPEHKVTATGVYIDDQQKYEFKTYELNNKQTNIINEGLSVRQLKINIDQFYES